MEGEAQQRIHRLERGPERSGIAVEILPVDGKVAHLARSSDQAGLKAYSTPVISW